MTVAKENQAELEQQLGVDLKSRELNLQAEEPLDDWQITLEDDLQESSSIDQFSTDMPQQQEGEGKKEWENESADPDIWEIGDGENGNSTSDSETQGHGDSENGNLTSDVDIWESGDSENENLTSDAGRQGHGDSENGNSPSYLDHSINHTPNHLETPLPNDYSQEAPVTRLRSQSLPASEEDSKQDLQLPDHEAQKLLKLLRELDSANSPEQPSSEAIIPQDENISVAAQNNGKGGNEANNGSQYLGKPSPTDSPEQTTKLKSQSLTSSGKATFTKQNSKITPEVRRLLKYTSTLYLTNTNQQENSLAFLNNQEPKTTLQQIEEAETSEPTKQEAETSEPAKQETDNSTLVVQEQETPAEDLPTDDLEEIMRLLEKLVHPEKLEPRLRALEQKIYERIDELIEQNTSKNRVAMGEALAAAIPIAISQQINKSPKEIANSLAPEMAEAIREQVLLERDAMVDALYPVIGSTISSYIGSELRAINEQIEHAFSVDAVSRKVRAKVRGVSEAELLLKETMHSLIRAIFLVHKGSGLVISDVQPSEGEKLESDMVAGMLTAIRSFASDCMANSGNLSELDEIYYGTSRIILEAAGYCYMAVVVDGEPPQLLIQKIRDTLRKIVENYGEDIKSFEGDPETIPPQVHSLVESLIYERLEEKKKLPVAVLASALAAFALLCVPLGIYWHKRGINRNLESDIELALAYSAPEVSVYQLKVDANQKTMKLGGRVPNGYMSRKVEKIAQEIAPTLEVDNRIVVLDLPPDPVLAVEEVKRVAYNLNQTEGVDISAKYVDGVVTLEGNVIMAEGDIPDLTQTFEEIPGVKSVNNSTKTSLPKIDTRLYFQVDSAELKSAELSQKLPKVQEFLEEYPKVHLRLTGYSDPSDLRPLDVDRSLAKKRAKTVQDILIQQGIAPERLQDISGTTEPPPGWDNSQSMELHRCVIFEPFIPTKNK
ncbi:MAG: OmpA family protein [Symploca sp. SIO1A3]|nr:OmpA family protein [Symploca sp. SIO1A3]